MKSRLFKLLWLAVIAYALPAISLGFYPGSGSPDDAIYHPERIIIKFKSDVRPAAQKGGNGTIATGISEVDNLHQKYNVTKQKRLVPEVSIAAEHNLSNLFVLQVEEGADILQAVE
jgi:hypothetical protein